MATITNIPEQGIDQLLETNRKMHSTMTDMHKLLSSMVSLMQKDTTVIAPDVESGILVSFEVRTVVQLTRL